MRISGEFATSRIKPFSDRREIRWQRIFRRIGPCVMFPQVFIFPLLKQFQTRSHDGLGKLERAAIRSHSLTSSRLSWFGSMILLLQLSASAAAATLLF